VDPERKMQLEAGRDLINSTKYVSATSFKPDFMLISGTGIFGDKKLDPMAD